MNRRFPNFVPSGAPRRQGPRRRDAGPPGTLPLPSMTPARKWNGETGRNGRNSGNSGNGTSIPMQASLTGDDHALCHQFSETLAATLECLRLQKQNCEETIRRRHDELEASRELRYAFDLIEAMGTGTVAFGSDTMRMALQMSTELLPGINPDTHQSLMETIRQLGMAWEHMMHLLQGVFARRGSAPPPSTSPSR